MSIKRWVYSSKFVQLLHQGNTVNYGGSKLCEPGHADNNAH